jgi:hypothetical protein
MGAGFVAWHASSIRSTARSRSAASSKDVGRVPPTFLIEEMVHRNALFAIQHAESMPHRRVIDEPEVTDLGDGVRAVDVVVREPRADPHAHGASRRR